MKKNFAITILVLLLLADHIELLGEERRVFLEDSQNSSYREIQFPKISFKYDWKSKILDRIGGMVFRCVSNQDKKELDKQLPDLMKAWEHNSSLFFEQLFSYFGRGFKNLKRTASLYLSHNASYGSNRFLILGLRHYLDPKDWSNDLSKQDHFCDLVFHELLHVWVDDNIRTDSFLRTKYCKERADVLDHIHLMALQKMIYLNLNRHDLIDAIDRAYRNFSTKDYQRAWEIVNDIEGYETVIQDIMNNLVR